MKITKRKDGRYQCNVYLGVDPVSGRRIQKTVSAKTKSECKAKANEILKNQDDVVRTYEAPKRLTLSDMCDIYINEYTGHIRDSTRRNVRKHIRYIKTFFDKTLLTKVTPVMVQSFVNDLSSHLAPNTTRNVYDTLHRILATAVEIDYLAESPCKGIRLPKKGKPGIHPLDEDQLKIFLESCQNDVYGDAMKLDAFTGLRISELVAITWDHIDLDERTMVIDRQLIESKKAAFKPTKNGKSRIVPLPDQAVRILRHRKAKQAEDRMKNRPYWTEQGFVFTDPVGSPLMIWTLRRRFWAVCEDCGFEDVRFHDLRHTYATLSLRSGVDYKSLSDALGHASVAFTMDVYAFTSEAMRQDHADKLGRFLADF